MATLKAGSIVPVRSGSMVVALSDAVFGTLEMLAVDDDSLAVPEESRRLC